VAVRGLCDVTRPRTVDAGGHQVACHVAEQELVKAGMRFEAVESGRLTP
jgi:hypothetical protein